MHIIAQTHTSTMNVQQFSTLIFSAIFAGEIIASLLARRFFTNKAQNQYSEALLAAVNKARQDVLKSNELIAEMESQNTTLRTSNLQLRLENQTLVEENIKMGTLVQQQVVQLNESLSQIDYWKNLYEKSLPNNRSKKGDKLN